MDTFASLRSVGRLYRHSDGMADLFALHIREARGQGATWTSIARDAQVTVRTAQKYAQRQAQP